MTRLEPLKIIVLCRSWREVDYMIHNLVLSHKFTAVNFGQRRIVTKSNDVIRFYTIDSKTMDGLSADVLVKDGEITNQDRQMVRYSRLDPADKSIWSYEDLLDYLGRDS